MRHAAVLTAALITFSSVPVFAQPASQPTGEEITMPDGVPKDIGEAMEKAKEGVDFAKAKNWWGLCAVGIFILMFIMKSLNLFKKIGKRWAYIIVPVLSVAAMLLTKFAGDLSWGAAITVLTSGPAMAVLSDFVKRGILAKESETPMKRS